MSQEYITPRRLNTYAEGTFTPLRSSIAEVEVSPAESAHAVGDYIYYNANLYKVISAIAVNDSLTVNTNIALVSVGNELKRLSERTAIYTAATETITLV